MANFFQANPEYTIDNQFPIQPAGTKHGPCVNMNCGHVRCEGKRRIVYSKCAVCNHRIGFGVQFTFEGTSFDTMGIVHADCVKTKRLGGGNSYGVNVVKPKRLGAAKVALPAPRTRRG